MRSFKVLFLALFYFGSVFFAVAALSPELAQSAAWFAVLLAMLMFLLLDSARANSSGVFYAVLIVFPISILFAGMIWWSMRWLGLLPAIK